MDGRLVILIVMGSLLLVWMVVMACVIFGKAKKSLVQSGITANVKCETCGTEYNVSAQEFAHSGMAKSLSVARTRAAGPILYKSREYKYYARKFRCPNCQRKRYAQVLNHSQIKQQTAPDIVRQITKYFAVMVAGGMVVLLIAGIGMFIAQKQVEQRLEQERREYFEEQYGDLLD